MKFLKSELLDIKGKLEIEILKIPLEQRKLIYRRIEKLNEIIQSLERLEKLKKLEEAQKSKSQYKGYIG